jgi:hypothetical protein
MCESITVLSHTHYAYEKEKLTHDTCPVHHGLTDLIVMKMSAISFNQNYIISHRCK